MQHVTQHSVSNRKTRFYSFIKIYIPIRLGFRLADKACFVTSNLYASYKLKTRLGKWNAHVINRTALAFAYVEEIWNKNVDRKKTRLAILIYHLYVWSRGIVFLVWILIRVIYRIPKSMQKKKVSVSTSASSLFLFLFSHCSKITYGLAAGFA